MCWVQSFAAIIQSSATQPADSPKTRQFIRLCAATSTHHSVTLLIDAGDVSSQHMTTDHSCSQWRSQEYVLGQKRGDKGGKEGNGEGVSLFPATRSSGSVVRSLSRVRGRVSIENAFGTFLSG